jgi:ABC-2 type transport system ATP-binding protein
MPGSHAIDITGLEVVRGGRRVLREISLTVDRGTVTGLIGPSGCGKTTLMRAVVGVQVIAAGRVHVLDAPAGASCLRSRVGYLTQAPAIYDDLTVEENLRYFAAIVGAHADRVEELLAELDLAPARAQLAGSLSGGQRTRVSLATALLNRPELLVLDEPTVGLDPVLRADLWHGFRRLAAGGTTLLISSHQSEEAAECHALLLLREGRLVDRTTPTELRARTGERELGPAFLAAMREAAA